MIVYCLLPTSIFAQSVDLLWQGETYTPPFYKGLSLWSNQSAITLVAITRGAGNPANINYRWIRNGTVLGNVSGVGRNSLSFADSVLSRAQTVTVELVSGDEDVIAESSITLRPFSPSLAIYEDNPLYGFMFHGEVFGTYPIKGSEVTFAAFPMFFSILGRNDPALAYKWRTNTGEVETRNSVTYRVPEQSSGTAAVSSSANNLNLLIQTAKKDFLVEFGKEE